jgi:putative tryptophan/tyrosine transport system substrate-binding protein
MMGYVTRRGLLVGIGTLLIARRSFGQSRQRVAVVGYIGFNTREENPTIPEAIQEGLGEQGFVVPRNLQWLERYAENSADAVEPLARELLGLGIEVLAVSGAATRRAIRAVGGRVPTVYGFSGDPMAAGLAESLARPLGRATGVSLMSVEINAKRIEILRDFAPATRRIALLSHPNHPGEAREVEVCRRTVAALGIELLYMPVHSREDVDDALANATAEGADAVVALPDSVTVPTRARVAEWALAKRVPFASGWAMFAESGALLTFGPNQRDCYRRVGHFAAKVLGGVEPATLPVEQPTTFELVFNLKTAKALGLAVSASQLDRADRVIE